MNTTLFLYRVILKKFTFGIFIGWDSVEEKNFKNQTLKGPNQPKKIMN